MGEPDTSRKAKTRKEDEKTRKIEIVGWMSHQIVGAKLPSNRQVLEVFFYNMRIVKLPSKESAVLAIDAALIFWQQARIPTREPHKCVNKLVKLYDVWVKIKKTKVPKMSTREKEQYDNFVANLDNLFDIASADALVTMKIAEDIEFLNKQRENGRPGAMLGIDAKLYAKEERARLRKEQEELRKEREDARRQNEAAAVQQSRK